MDLQIIKTNKECEHLLDWVDSQFDLNLATDSKEGQQLQTALLLIKQYEDAHHVVPYPGTAKS